MSTINASRAAWLDNPQRDRMIALCGLLLAYQGISREITRLPWTAQRLRLLNAELTALQAGNVAQADRVLTVRLVHDQALTRAA